MLGGRYQLGDVLGEGGAATVYRALDLLEGRTCAVKVVRVEGADRARLVSQLQQESEVLQRLSHPNIVHILGTGEEESGPWIAMELVEGGSVADRVARDGPVSPRRALQVVLQLLRGLEVVHAAGILHRDIKPDNLLQRADGTCKLADFGIALIDSQTPTTSAGRAMGSLPYMAPEQRINPHSIDVRADLYSAGATLYYLVTGATPLDLFLSSPTSPRFAGLPEGLVALIRRGTHADPVQRFQSAGEMAVAVTDCLSLVSDEVRGQSIPSASPLQKGSRVVTAEVPTAAGDLEALEAELQREWREEKARNDRYQTQRTARWSVGIAITLLGVLVATAGRFSLENWVAREEARHVALSTPITGTWRGTVGSKEAVLSLHGPDAFLSGSFTWRSGTEVRKDAVRGVLEQGLLILKTDSSNGETGQYRALIAVSGRLDGDYMSVTNTVPFHLVQVQEPGP